MAGDPTLINGNAYSWASIKAKVDGVDYTGFFEISYGDKVERVKLYGMGSAHKPRGRSKGKYTTEEGKLKGSKSSVQLLKTALAAKSKSGKSFGNSEFTLTVQYVEGDETPITDVLSRCVITSHPRNHTESADPLSDEITFDYFDIKTNGQTLYEGGDSGGLIPALPSFSP